MAGHTLGRSPAGVTYTDKQPCTLMDNLVSSINLTCRFVDGGRTCKLQKGTWPTRRWNLGPSSYEATVLTLLLRWIVFNALTCTFRCVRISRSANLTSEPIGCCMFSSASRPRPVLLWKLLLCCWLAWRQMWIPVWHQPMGKQAEMHISRWQNLQQQRLVSLLHNRPNNH